MLDNEVQFEGNLADKESLDDEDLDWLLLPESVKSSRECEDYVKCILENWLSSIATPALFGIILLVQRRKTLSAWSTPLMIGKTLSLQQQ